MRVTVDLDTAATLPMLSAYYNLKTITDDVEVYRTNRGYHIVGYGLPITQDDAIDIRQLLGDDANRIHLDEVAAKGGCAKPMQILWSHKHGRASRHKIDIPSALY